MSRSLRVGDIVVLKTGRTPLQVIGLKTRYTQNPGVHAKYCGIKIPRAPLHAFKYGNEDDYNLVTDLALIEPCKGWRDRLSDAQHKQLELQISEAQRGWLKFQIPNSLHDQTEKESIMSQQNHTKLYQTLEDEPRFGTYMATNSKGQIILEMKGSDGNPEAFDPKDIEEVLPWTFRVSTGGLAFRAPKDAVKIGDILVQQNQNTFLTVSAVNTKQVGAPTFKGSKLTSTPVEVLEDPEGFEMPEAALPDFE